MFGGLQGLVSRSLPALRGMSKEEPCRWSPVSKSVASEVLSVAARCRCLALTPLVLPLFADCLEKGHTSHKLRACDSGSMDHPVCKHACSCRSVQFVRAKVAVKARGAR